MKLSTNWDFVRIHERAEWSRSTDCLSVVDAVAMIENVAPRTGWSRRFPSASKTPYVDNDDSFLDTRTIICVEPLIAVSVPIEDSVVGDSPLISPDSSAASFKFAGARVQPPRGYRYGTRLPYRPTVTVIMPGEAPNARVRTADGNLPLDIQVPWGRIELARVNDQWQAIAHKSRMPC
jgi:hypothetical protein